MSSKVKDLTFVSDSGSTATGAEREGSLGLGLDYREIIPLFPAEETESDQLDLVSTFRSRGVEVVEEQPGSRGSDSPTRERELPEDSSSDLLPGAPEKDSDSVRLYL